jgi:ADP-ribosyltransferase exoenzyme
MGRSSGIASGAGSGSVSGSSGRSGGFRGSEVSDPDAWAERHFGQHDRAATPREEAAVTAYAGQAYIDINTHLRTGERPFNKEVTDERVRELKKYIARSSVPEDVLAYRGMPGRLIPEVGDDVTDNGFTSISLKKDVAARFSNSNRILEIEVPKGHKAGWVRPRDHRENELLLAPGTKFRVVSERTEVIDRVHIKISRVRIIK